MNKHRRTVVWVNTNLLLVALLLAAMVFFSPNFGQNPNQSFLAVAWQSPWSQWFDWPAAWCSVKIVLLGVALLCLVEVVWNFMFQRENGFTFFTEMGMVTVSLLLCGFGFFELVKAVL